MKDDDNNDKINKWTKRLTQDLDIWGAKTQIAKNKSFAKDWLCKWIDDQLRLIIIKNKFKIKRDNSNNGL